MRRNIAKIVEEWCARPGASAQELRDFGPVIVRIQRKAEAFETLMSAGDLSRAFIGIERVFSREPVDLFSEPFPSHAFNRISVHRGIADPETGDVVPGDRVISLLISEESLARFMLNPNRGSTGAGVTLESLGDDVLGPWRGDRPDPAAIFLDMLESGAGSPAERAAEISKGVRGLKKPLPPARAQDLSRHVADLAGKAKTDGNISFALERHVEALQKLRTSMVVEMGHTAHSIEQIMAATQTPLLAGPGNRSIRFGDEAALAEARSRNPVLDAFCGADAEEAVFLARVAKWKAIQVLRSAGVEIGDDASPGRNAIARVAGGKWDWLSSLINAGENEHVLDQESRTSPWEAQIGFNLVHGFHTGVHSSVSSKSDDMCRLRLSTSTTETSYGEVKLREGREVFEVALTPSDFMDMLRSPDGAMARCNITRIAGAPVAQVDHETPVEKSIRAVAEASAASPQAGGIEEEAAALLRRASALIAKGLPEREDRDRLAEMIEAIGELAEAAGARRREDALTQAEAARGAVRDEMLAAASMIGRKSGVPVEVLIGRTPIGEARRIGPRPIDEIEEIEP
jgi:hypothetical protein